MTNGGGWAAAALGVALLVGGAMARAADAGLPPDLRAEVRDLHSLPSGRYEAVRAWAADGPNAGHQTGRAVADAAASGGHAWEAAVGRDGTQGALLYGPYLDVPAGDYVAFFRIKILDDAGEENVATVDAAVDHGQQILVTRDLTGGDLRRGRYVEVPLAFHDPGGPLECRATWHGYDTIRIDRVALFRLTGGSVYVAPFRVPEAVPSGSQNDLVDRPERRPFPELFPRSEAPASRLRVVDLRGLPPDQQLMLLSLQGLVNRRRPEIYCLFNPTDPKWLDWMKRRGWTRATETIRDPESLLATYRSRFTGVVVTDPRLPATRNAATMLAGVRNALVVSPRLAKRLRLPIVADLRGRFHSNIECYRWSFDHLWPKLNHHVVACSYPDHLGLRDYLVENRVFIFWLTGAIDGAKPYANPTAQARLMERLFARMPANIPVMSYPWAGKEIGIGEGPGVTLFAEFAKFLVGSIDVSNLSVHSGIRIGLLHQRPPARLPLRRDKIYVSFVISDGDNLPVLTANNFPQLWASPIRGHLPLGWSMTPSAWMLIPDIADYYFSTATPDDEFLGAVSGVGYTYPDSYAKRYREPDRARLFDGFLSLTDRYMKKLGETDLWIMNADRPQSIRRYAERIPDLDALFPDYGKRVESYADATHPTARNVPVFHALTSWQEALPRETQIASVVSQIRGLAPRDRPAFMHLFVLNWFADLPMLREIARRLGPDYVVVRPDQLAALYRREMAADKLLIRAPTEVVAIGGRRLRFAAVLQNVTGASFEARLAVPSGLERPSISPLRLRMAPGRPATVELSGAPAGDTVRLSARGPFGTRSARVAVRRIPPSEIAGSLPVGGDLVFQRRFLAVDLAHRSGKAALDPAAGGERVWSAVPGRDESGFVLFGPYVDLPRGRYLALFRVRRTGGSSGTIATLDASANGGKTVMAQRALTPGDLPAGKWRYVPLAFDHPGGPLETRVRWAGEAALSVDTIDVWRLRTIGALNLQQ